MTALKLSDPHLFKKKIPPDEIVCKFIATEGLLSETNDIIVSLNRNYCNAEKLKIILKSEFEFLNTGISTSVCEAQYFTHLEAEQAFVDFLAITLVSKNNGKDSSSYRPQKDISITPEGVLRVVCNSARLTLADYFISVQEYIKRASWPLTENNMRFIASLTLPECAQLKGEK